MTRRKNPNETTLLIKLPPELKASFQGLCKFRGVAVSVELRRFMADEVAKTAQGMTTNDKPLNAVQARLINPKVVSTRKSFKNAVQADLVLSDNEKSTTKANVRGTKPKQRKKRSK